MCLMADSLSKNSDSTHLSSHLGDLKTQLPPPIRQLANSAPYSPLQPLIYSSLSLTKAQMQRLEAMESSISSKTSGRKRERSITENPKSAQKLLSKKHSSSTSNLFAISSSGGSGGTRGHTRSISPSHMHHTHSEFVLNSPPGPPGGQNPPTGNCHIPSEVLILPISTGAMSLGASCRNTAFWDFTLLSEEEVRANPQIVHPVCEYTRTKTRLWIVHSVYTCINICMCAKIDPWFVHPVYVYTCTKTHLRIVKLIHCLLIAVDTCTHVYVVCIQ